MRLRSGILFGQCKSEHSESFWSTREKKRNTAAKHTKTNKLVHPAGKLEARICCFENFFEIRESEALLGDYITLRTKANRTVHCFVIFQAHAQKQGRSPSAARARGGGDRFQVNGFIQRNWRQTAIHSLTRLLFAEISQLRGLDCLFCFHSSELFSEFVSNKLLRRDVTHFLLCTFSVNSASDDENLCSVGSSGFHEKLSF